MEVIGPEGRPRDLRRVGEEFIVSDTDVAGQYRIRAGGYERRAAVNPDLNESNLARAESAATGPTSSADVSLAAAVAVGRLLILLAVALLALEWWLRLRGAW